MSAPAQILTYKYRLLPTKAQHADLVAVLDSQRQLFNACLQERIDCYTKTGRGISYNDQCKSLAELRTLRAYAGVPSNLQRWTLNRVDHSYEEFFRRSKRGLKAGFPRFRSKTRWKSFGFKEAAGMRFDGKRIRFKGMTGGLRVHMHRAMPKDVEIKAAVFRRDVKGWFVALQCAVPHTPTPHRGGAIGIDVGIASFATLSSGEAIPNPHIARRAEKEFRRRERALARCRRDSNRRRKVQARLTRLHDKVANERRTFLHQQSRRLATNYALIAVEDLKIENMLKNHHLARSIADAGWRSFTNMLTYKAEGACGRVVRINPRNTSQVCSDCGGIVPKELSERVHRCACGLVLDRDVNAARNILALAVTGQGQANVAECGERPCRKSRRRDVTRRTNLKAG